jgi:putative flavoprotein involved in K+ transport
MTPDRDGAAAIVDQWLASLEGALSAGDAQAVKELFLPDSHWRDVLALTWDIRTVSGAEALADPLRTHAQSSGAKDFRRANGRTPPRHVTRAGEEAIEAIIAFETRVGPCNAILRLKPATNPADSHKAWTLTTILDEINGHEEVWRRPQQQGKSFSRDFRGPNWLDTRLAEARYQDREPAVLVVGAGQAGLAIAARLRQLGVDTLVVERNARVGDNWRKRYHALTLHNQTKVNHFPYMPFPPGWPTYIPKDKLAGWFETYAQSMEINVWTSTALTSARWDVRDRCWDAEVRREDGTTRIVRPHHLVLATGSIGTPNLPEIPTLERFTGTVLHSSQFTDGESWRDKRAIVIGTGTSGHDIAQDLYSSGASVSIVQRATTMVVNIEPSAQLPYTLYEEGPSFEDCDLITVGIPYALLKRGYQLLTAEGARIDAPLLKQLEKKGFRLDFGEDGTGWQYKFLTRGGGYYFNVGCSDLIADGAVGFLRFEDIESFAPEGARLRNGETLPADLIVLATGYKGQDHIARALLGTEVTERIGPIWGFGDEQELCNMFKRTAQPGLWFIAGSFAQCRIYSKYLALQITACEAGLIPSTR